MFSSVDAFGFSLGTNNAGLLKCFPSVFSLARLLGMSLDQ